MHRLIICNFIFVIIFFLSYIAIASESCHDFTSCKSLALLGNKDAEYNIAVIYDLGKNIQADPKEAFKYYEKAALHGHKVAQYRMGDYYRLGNIVSRDFNQAAKWYKLSANQGHSMAKAKLWQMTKLKQISLQDVANDVVGSGFFVNNSYIVTNNHVASGCSNITIYSQHNNFKATFVSGDTFHDLALLKSEKSTSSYLPLSKHPDLKQWDELTIIGFDGKTGTLTSRLAKLVHPNKEFVEKIGNSRKIVPKLIITKSASSGFSGGPVINNFGKVVGINSAGASSVIDNTGYDLAIPLKSLKYFLDENKIDYHTPERNSSDIDNNAIVKIICER